MSYIGALAVILATFLIWREYVSYLDGEHACYCAFYRALGDYREHVRCYLEPPVEWALGYEDDLLLECGFLGALREGGEMSVAYLSSRNNLLLDSRVDKILTECFERLGGGYLDTELATLDLAISQLSRMESESACELSRKRKVAGAFLGACASGIVIMII